MADTPFYSSGASRAFLRQGGLVIQDDDGNDIAFIGLMSDGTRRGVELLNQFGDSLLSFGELPDGSRGLLVESATDGWDLVKMTTDGWAAPHLAGVPSDPAAVKSVTSGTFASQWQVTFGSVLGRGVEVMIPWATDVGTTGELQVISNVPSTTQVVSLPSGGNSYKYVRWTPGLRPGTGPLILQVQARRASGAGNVYVYPCQGWVQDPTLCFDGGNWL
jgi:hypothetical protein